MYCKDYTITFISNDKILKRYIKFMTETEAQEYMQSTVEKYNARVTEVSRFTQNYEVHYYVFLKMFK